MFIRLVFCLLVVILGICIGLCSYRFSKRGKFYADTLWLSPFGVYVWGDGLVLGPFWFISGLLFYLLTPLNIIRYYLLFIVLRAAYETVYWLVHQSSQRTFIPPLLRRVGWLGGTEAAIVYQLLNMMWVMWFSFLLVLTFVGW
jgi:hypothetical protein